MPDIHDFLSGAPRDVAAIDIGSNSIRLVLYRLEGRAIWTVFNEKVLAGLGRELTRTGRLSVDGVEQALVALKRFAAVLEGVQPSHAFVAATAAVREASDGADFCARVAAETGLQVQVLTGEEEAHRAAMGVLAGIPDAAGVVGDLGGSSLELVPIGEGRVGRGVTLPLGPFSMGDALDLDARRAEIAARLDPADGFRGDTLYAVGGAWRTLAQAHMSLTGYPLHIVHQYEMGAAEARETARLVARQSRESLEKWPGLTKKRAETLPHAALVLEGLIDRLGLKRIVLSAWGVREGLLYDALDPQTAATDPLLAGCTALGARQGVSPALAGALKAWISPMVGALPPSFSAERDGILADAACRLADIGARLHPDHRVELAFDQVLRAPVPGQTHAERAWLAAAINARYGGPSATPASDLVRRLLTDDQRRSARAVGLAIRMACDLSGRSPQLLANAHAAVRGGRLILTAADGYADVLLGEQARKRGKAAAEALGLRLEIDGGDTG